MTDVTDGTDGSDEFRNMTEKELKNHVNSLRQQISRSSNEIKRSIEEIKTHRESSNELRKKRDELNRMVKECAKKAEICRKARDEVNKQIVDLKKLRGESQNHINKHRTAMDQLKEKRDGLNATAKMNTASLEKAYAHELYVLTRADVPLNHEIDAYGRLLVLGERLIASRAADEVHNELLPVYKEVKKLRKTADKIHHTIQELADESQRHHDELLAVYAKMDNLRKEANQYHAWLKDKTRVIEPLSKSIDAQKVSVAKPRDELSLCLDILKETQTRGNANDREVALEKLKTTGRMSLEDLKVLMDSKDIKFD